MLKIWKYWRAVEVIPRLPEHYRKYLFELEHKPPRPVHFYPDPETIKKDEMTGEVRRIENRPIPLLFPKKCHEGLWGGEGIIKGFRKTKFRKRRVPTYWFPVLKQTPLYSEILDQTMSVIVTERTLNLIDEAHGFDYYILKTHPVDLRSQLGMDLRRKMLLTLVRKEMYPNDEKKRNEIYEKYKRFIIPEEEAEWHGLTLVEAIRKQVAIEEELNTPVPLKISLRKEYIESLKERKGNENPEDKQKSDWTKKLNPFSKDT